MRALIDPNLTDRDVRILAVIAAYDQMSLVTKRGQGAWASHRTMAGKVAQGSNESNFSGSVSKLIEHGYLEVTRKADDRRRRVYRVKYTEEDALFWGKASAATNPETTLPGETLSDGEHLRTSAQYIPLSRRYSAEAKKDIPLKGRTSVCRNRRNEFANNVGAQLAALERSLNTGEPIDLIEAYRFVGSAWEIEEHRGRAFRLSEELWLRMTPEERKQFFL